MDMSGFTSDGLGAVAQLILGILFVSAIQGLQAIGLHCVELLVNMWRGECNWRAARNRGACLKTGAVSSAMLSGPYVFLFVMKALLHWLLGQSISPSVNVAPTEGAGDPRQRRLPRGR